MQVLLPITVRFSEASVYMCPICKPFNGFRCYLADTLAGFRAALC